jgi:hypothetical protein
MASIHGTFSRARRSMSRRTAWTASRVVVAVGGGGGEPGQGGAGAELMGLGADELDAHQQRAVEGGPVRLDAAQRARGVGLVEVGLDPREQGVEVLDVEAVGGPVAHGVVELAAVASAGSSAISQARLRRARMSVRA